MMPVFHPWKCWIWIFSYTGLPGVEVSLPSLLSSHQSHPLSATKTLVMGLIFDLLFLLSVVHGSQIPGRSTTFPSHITHSHLADIPSSGLSSWWSSFSFHSFLALSHSHQQYVGKSGLGWGCNFTAKAVVPPSSDKAPHASLGCFPPFFPATQQLITWCHLLFHNVYLH